MEEKLDATNVFKNPKSLFIDLQLLATQPDHPTIQHLKIIIRV
jgi:hypothetical protein